MQTTSHGSHKENGWTIAMVIIILFVDLIFFET